MASFSVRTAEREDFPAIRALIHAVHINPLGLNWRHFVAAISPIEGFLGCGQIKPHGDGSREVASVAVREQARGRGVARAIIQELLAREKQRPLYLMCRASLGSFYIKFGFRAIEACEMPRYFRRISRVERIFSSKAKPEDRLLVMCID